MPGNVEKAFGNERYTSVDSQSLRHGEGTGYGRSHSEKLSNLGFEGKFVYFPAPGSVLSLSSYLYSCPNAFLLQLFHTALRFPPTHGLLRSWGKSCWTGDLLYKRGFFRSCRTVVQSLLFPSTAARVQVVQCCRDQISIFHMGPLTLSCWV